MSNPSYSHTVKVFSDLPTPATGYQNPVHREIGEDEKNVTVDMRLQVNARPAGRLYEIEQNGSLSNVLKINDPEVLSIFVANNVDTIQFQNCKKLEHIQFANPSSIKVLSNYCFWSVVGYPEIDLSSFTNLSCVESKSIAGLIRFKDDKLILPSSIQALSSGAVWQYRDNSNKAQWKISELIFTPVNQVSVRTSEILFLCPGAGFAAEDKPYTLSSITLNDNAINILSSCAFVQPLTDGFARAKYREIHLETLSGMHGLSGLKMHGIFETTDNQHRMTALSGNVYTFSHYPLSDLEDQNSHVFDDYLALLPDESFVTRGLNNAIYLSALSVWVPAALYDAWCGAWPNYTSVVYPYGYSPEPPTPVTPRETTFHFADAPDETYLFGSGFGRQILAYKGFILNGVWLKLPTSVELGSDIKDIGAETFLGCSSLSSVTIPSSVSAISWDAFKNCNEKLYDMTTISGVKLVDGWAVEADYDNLPNDLNLIGCRGIAECLFAETNIISAIIGNTTTRISGSAFADCGCLTTVMIPNSIISIQDGVFDNCPNLSTIYVSAGDTARITALLRASGLDTTNITFIEQ